MPSLGAFACQIFPCALCFPSSRRRTKFRPFEDPLISIQQVGPSASPCLAGYAQQHSPEELARGEPQLLMPSRLRGLCR